MNDFRSNFNMIQIIFLLTKGMTLGLSFLYIVVLSWGWLENGIN